MSRVVKDRKNIFPSFLLLSAVYCVWIMLEYVFSTSIIIETATTEVSLLHQLYTLILQPLIVIISIGLNEFIFSRLFDWKYICKKKILNFVIVLFLVIFVIYIVCSLSYILVMHDCVSYSLITDFFIECLLVFKHHQTIFICGNMTLVWIFWKMLFSICHSKEERK